MTAAPVQQKANRLYSCRPAVPMIVGRAATGLPGRNPLPSHVREGAGHRRLDSESLVGALATCCSPHLARPRGQRWCGKLIPHCALARAPLPAPSGVTPALSSSFATIAETADNCSSGESEAARPPEGGGVRSAKGGKGRSGAEARTFPTSPIRVRFGARAHWGAGSRPKEPPAVPPIGYFRQVSSPVTSAPDLRHVRQ